jgi:tRNA dimethylallyltransferase
MIDDTARRGREHDDSMEAVLIAGPTSAGKSSAARALAERINGVVINADSMQVYAGLPVLSGQPSAEDRAGTPHRLYGHVSPAERYSSGRYQQEAQAAFTAARAEGRVPIFAGGTGLYFNALTQGLAPIPAVPPEVRAMVRQRFETLGRDEFYADLVRRDPAAAALRRSDSQRVLRAADVFEATGRGIAAWQAVARRPVLGELKLARFVIAPDREILNERINRRFEDMVGAGALAEVQALSGLDPSLPAARMLGFPELSRHLRGEITLDQAIATAQMMTRRFAKRQLTWFRRYMADWRWITATVPEGIAAAIAGER